ncbi:hypothetical protein LB823_07495 [Tsukamurella sp. M9C]|uniref:hypothetical protein n=1 Tax=Tsukamurella sp. M9C TaxID=2877520 RepID=UPI001CCCE020|nr:hypothetical protein [Tsukamurella sp. M9C]MCA0156038.1 hypothetical protein [Tsukamurella sp. M9C]
MTDHTGIRTFIDDRAVAPEAVRAWEERRLRAVFRRLASGLGARATAELLPDESIADVLRAPIQVQRDTLTAMKTRLGHAGIYALLRRELAFSEATTRATVAVSRGRTATSVTRLEAPGVSAERFGAWFDDLTASNREGAMLAACPDHYLLRGLPDGRQEVVETTGGTPTASRFLVDCTRSDRLTIAADPAYPIQIAGLALLDDGTCIGGVRHQLRDRDGALDALLTVEFPAAVPAHFLRQHQWHLAVEFGNWISAAAREIG